MDQVEESKDIVDNGTAGGGSGSNNDFIIDEGFPVLNTFTLPTTTTTKSSNKISSSEKKTITPEKETKKLLTRDPIIPRHDFISYSSAISTSSQYHDNLLHDLTLTFNARTIEDNEAYSTGSTFFLPCTMKPRCALEHMAKQIFDFHVRDCCGLKDDGVHYDLERSGAEWWTLVLNSNQTTTAAVAPSGAVAIEKGNVGSNSAKDEEEEEEEEEDEVGMHFDADYGLEEQLPNYMVHPRIATVTYLSDVGVPTLILNQKSPPPTDVEKKSLNGSTIDKAFLSHPSFGKHIAFDGRLLHGAPGDVFPAFSSSSSSSSSTTEEKGGLVDGEEEMKNSKRQKLNNGNDKVSSSYSSSSTTNTNPEYENKRITFMVNIWLNHCPIDAEVIDDDLCTKMKTLWKNDDNHDNTKKEKDSTSTTTTTGGGNLKRNADYDQDSSSLFQWSLSSVHKDGDELSKDKLVKTSTTTAAAAAAASAASSASALAASSANQNDNDDDDILTQEAVICNREVKFHFQTTLEECHRISQTTFDSKGKSMEFALMDDVLTLEVGDEVEDSDEE